MKKLIIVLLCLCLACSFAACVNDGPPKEDTPDPPALSGVFEHQTDTMSFNGDGRSVELDISKEISELTGLPEGKSSGTYVFILQNGSYRYDKAEYFRIMLDEKTYQFYNDLGVTAEDTVAFNVDNDSRTELVFRKTAATSDEP